MLLITDLLNRCLVTKMNFRTHEFKEQERNYMGRKNSFQFFFFAGELIKPFSAPRKKRVKLVNIT